MDFKIPVEKQHFTNLDYLISDPTDNDYQKEQVQSKLLEIDELCIYNFEFEYN